MPLIGTGAATPYHGATVALTADGNTLVEAGWNSDSSIGGYWVWRYNTAGNRWDQVAGPIRGTGATGSTPLHGKGLTVSPDGSTILSAGLGDNSASGAVVSFEWKREWPAAGNVFWTVGRFPYSHLLLCVQQTNNKHTQWAFALDVNNVVTTNPTCAWKEKLRRTTTHTYISYLFF